MFFIEYTVQVGIVIFDIKCMHIIQEFPTKFQCMKRIWAVFVFSRPFERTLQHVIALWLSRV